MSPRCARCTLAALLAANACFAPDVGASPAGGVAAAEALFQEGRRLLEAGDTRAACPKLAESLSLERATGTLLALARCHELEGRLASARVEYQDVIARSRRERRADREQAARQWAQALEGRLSTMTIIVPVPVTEIAGLRIERDGEAVAPDVWSTPVPVDPGPHVVRATAPGRTPWSTSVSVGRGDVAERRAITVPLLAPTAVSAIDPPAQVSTVIVQERPGVAPPPRSDTTESLALLGGVAAGTTTAALGLQLAGMHRSGWGAAVRGVWLMGPRGESIDDSRRVTVRSYALRACALRRVVMWPRLAVQLGPEVLFHLDHADGTSLSGGRTAWRGVWAVGAGGDIAWSLGASWAWAVVASLDYGRTSWGGTLDVTNRGDILQPIAVRWLVAMGPRWAFELW